MSNLEALFYTMSAEPILAGDHKVEIADVHKMGLYKRILDDTVASLEAKYNNSPQQVEDDTTSERQKTAFAWLAKHYKMDSALPDLHGEAMLIADSLYSGICSNDGGEASGEEASASIYKAFFESIATKINPKVNGYFEDWLCDGELSDLKAKLSDGESININFDDAVILKNSFIKFMESKRQDLRDSVIKTAKESLGVDGKDISGLSSNLKPAELCVRLHTDFTDSTEADSAHRGAYILVMPAEVHNKGNNELADGQNGSEAASELKINGSQVERYDQDGGLISVDQRLPSTKPGVGEAPIDKLRRDIARLENVSSESITDEAEDDSSAPGKKAIVITRLTSLTPTNRWYGGELECCFSLALKGLWDTGTMLISPFHRGLIGTAANYFDESKNQQFKRAVQELDNIEEINLARMEPAEGNTQAEDPVYFFQANINQQGLDISKATSGVELKARVHADMALIATLAESDSDQYQDLLDAAKTQYLIYLKTIDADADDNADAVKEISRLRQTQSVQTELKDVPSVQTELKDVPKERLSQALAKLMSLEDNACFKPENVWLTAALAKSLQSCGAAGCKSAMDRYKDWMETVEVFQMYKNLSLDEINRLPRFKELHQELEQFIESTPSCLLSSSPVSDLNQAVNAAQKDHTADSYSTNVMMDGKSTSKLGQTRIFEPVSIGAGLFNSLAVGGFWILAAKSAPTVVATTLTAAKIGFLAAPLVIGTLTVPFAPVVCTLALVAFYYAYKKTVNTNNTRPMSYEGDTGTRMKSASTSELAANDKSRDTSKSGRDGSLDGGEGDRTLVPVPGAGPGA